MSTLNVNTVRDSGGAGTSDTNALGQGQTYQNVTAQRVAGTTYTNNTGRPIWISINETGNGVASITVNGVVVAAVNTNNIDVQLTAIVPNNGTYVFSGGIASWIELRT